MNSSFLNVATVAAGLVVASGVASIAIALLMGDIRIFTLVFIIVSAVAVVLGLPVYLAARAARNDTRLIAIVMGFVVGAAIPAFLIFAGPRAGEASIGDTATIINGSYTAAGWLENFGLIGLFGIIGAGSALLFWFLVRRRISADERREEQSPVRPLRTTFLSLVAVGFISAAFAIPSVTADRTCHNPLRDGRNSIGPVAAFDLEVGVDQWPALDREVKAFGRLGNWSIINDVRTDPSFQWLQISLCKEPGTNIMVQGMPDNKEISFAVYQPQGGSSWQPDFRALYERISARWPTKIVFNDNHGSPTNTPVWVAK